ncbi:MAG: hypothetical protein ABIF77_20820 [bacterium]
MKSIKVHSPILLLILCVTYVVYGKLLSAPFWSPIDLQILREAHQLSLDPWPMFQHIGTYLNQPALQVSFLVEFYLFCDNPAGYLGVNLFIHCLNAFMVYMLVNMLFHQARMATLAAILFALAVGSYGKIFMSVANFEALLLSHLYLLVLYCLIRNDFRHDGRLGSPYFLLGLALFGLASLTRATSFSILGCLLAYKFFFYKERGGRAVLSRNILVLLGVGIVFYAAQSKWGNQAPVLFGHTDSPLVFTWISFKNIFRYLNLMVFPMQTSAMLATAHPLVILVYDIRTYIRMFLTLTMVSYSFFGIVFGSRAVRFFIAWTIISLLPFTGVSSSGEWLNVTHLYLASIGFCLILAAGAMGCFNLLKARRWRRFVPFLVPLLYAILAVGITDNIDERNRRAGQAPAIQEQVADLSRICRR